MHNFSPARLLPLVLALALGGAASAGPITVKEVDFLLRQGTSEAEIVREVRARRFLIPMDAAGEATLRSNGASPALLQQLKAPAMVFPPDEARAIAQRLVDAQKAADSAPQPAGSMPAAPSTGKPGSTFDRTTTARMFEGKVSKLDNGSLSKYSGGLRDVRIFGIYTGMGRNAVTRGITLELAEIYRRVQKEYPGEFEVVYLPGKRDDFNTGEYARRMQTPWLIATEPNNGGEGKENVLAMRFVDAYGQKIFDVPQNGFNASSLEATVIDYIKRSRAANGAYLPTR